MAEFVVCALYRFTRLDNYTELQKPLYDFLKTRAIKGTLLLASEGLNGTVSGSRKAIQELLAYLNEDARLAGIDYKCALHEENPFYRTKVRLKKEIVTMGVEAIDPRHSAGTYVEPEEWNALIEQEDTLLIDTRNEYEIGIGTFTHAINPHTDTFREFPAYASKHLDPQKHKKIAMFCTGGIRCEKSTAFLKEQGFEEVYHLKGGILNYLEKIPESESLWQGECFVFDNRVSVDHQLEKGTYDQCHACRMPITKEDQAHPDYLHGISCPHCVDQTDEKQKERFRERQRQIALAKERGVEHIGEASEVNQTRSIPPSEREE